MNKRLLIIFLLIPFAISSQEIDEEFLSTLPESVRADVQSKMEAKKASEEPVYRSASTMIDKPLAKNSIFGRKFFDVMQSSFMPINEPNFDSKYILDYGDVIEIQLFGSKDSINQYSIKRDGSINIAEIGNVQLAGLSLDDASKLIKSKINNLYIGTESYVSLISIRDIQVLITGNAYNPGIYTLNGNSNILHALSMAGGIDENGSYREVQLIRDNKVIAEIDLYDIFIFGKNDYGARLKSGDSIFIGTTKNIVNAVSGVNRPGLYELKDGETFNELLGFANGLKSAIDKDFIQVQSVDGNNIETINLNIDNLVNTVVKDNDSLIIREFSYGTVTIDGAVKSPGMYKISEGEKLSNLINRAGGYTKYAYPFGGFLNNGKTQKLNEAAKVKLYNSFISNLIEKGSLMSGDSSFLSIVLDQLKESEVSGRVIAEFDLDVIMSNPELDTLIEDGDQILIPKITQQVYVYGEVSNQGGVRYIPNKDYRYYISASGGALSSADHDSIYIVSPNGETTNLNVKNSRLSFINNNNPQLIYPGSIIYVPRTSNIESSLAVASIWAPIISGIALSIASISSINN